MTGLIDDAANAIKCRKHRLWLAVIVYAYASPCDLDASSR